MFDSIAFYFSSDTSESEENAVYSAPKPQSQAPKKRKKLPLHTAVHLQRKIMRDSVNVLDLPEEHFIQQFRVNKEVFRMILDEIAPKLPPGMRSTHLPAATKLARFLAFVTTGISGKNKEYSRFMSKSQVSRTIREINDVFVEHLSAKWLTLDQSEENELVTKQGFQNAYGLPGLVGCVDNTHIRIVKPDKDKINIYSNQTGVASLNVLLICDHNKVIKFVDASQPGGFQDAYVWEQSKAEKFFRTNYLNGKTNTYLVGDAGHKLLPYLMTPYKNPKEEYEIFFNEKLSKASETIDQCITELKNHFSCLKSVKGLYYTPEKAEKTIISCCILHNICIKYKNTWRPTNSTFNYTETSVANDDYIDSNDECEESRSLRDQLAVQSFLAHAIPKSSPEPAKETNDNKRLRPAAALLDYPDVKFMRTFGVNKKVFSALLEEIKPNLKVTYRNTHTPAPIKLAAFLEFLATGGQLKSLGNEYTSTISKCHVSKIVCEFLDLFEQHLYGKWIKLEQSQDEENTAKQHFYNATGLSGVVGCVDNMHIQIKTPGKDVKKLYVNRKDVCSLNVMIICDHNMVIKYVDANQPGSYHDAYVWDQSSADNYFYTNYLSGKTDTWLLGDLAYKLQPYLMIPYKDADATHEYEFNYRHFEARKIIKNCLDILKNRFKCLTSEAGLQYTPEKASKIITACCIIHNICINYKNYWQPCNFSLECLDDDDGEENIIEAPNIGYAAAIRDKVAQNLKLCC